MTQRCAPECTAGVRARDSRSDPVGFGPTDADGNPAGSNTAFMVGARYDF